MNAPGNHLIQFSGKPLSWTAKMVFASWQSRYADAPRAVTSHKEPESLSAGFVCAFSASRVIMSLLIGTGCLAGWPLAHNFVAPVRFHTIRQLQQLMLRTHCGCMTLFQPPQQSSWETVWRYFLLVGASRSVQHTPGHWQS